MYSHMVYECTRTCTYCRTYMSYMYMYRYMYMYMY